MKKFLCFLLILFFTFLIEFPVIYALVLYYNGTFGWGIIMGAACWVQLVIIVTSIRTWIEKVFDISFS